MSPRYKQTPWTLSAVKVPSGSRVWYYYYRDEDGKRKHRSTGIGFERDRDKVRTRNEANEFCMTLFRAGKLGSRAEGLTLAGWVDKQQFFDWRRSRWVRGILSRSPKDKPGITEGYVIRAGSLYKAQIEPQHGALVIDEITRSDCEDLLFQWQAGGAAHKTINNWRSVYSTILAEAERLQVIAENPWRYVQQLGVDPKQRGGLTLAEGARIIAPAGVDHDNHAHRMYYLCTKLSMLTGLRISEAVGLHTDDVREKTIAINETSGAMYSADTTATMYYIDCNKQYSVELKKRVPVKDKDARAIPITPDLFAELEPLLTGPARYLFSMDEKRQASPISGNRVREWMYARMVEVGIDRTARNITFHSTRRFFNTLLRRRVSADVVRKMTGHDSDEMTEHYTDYLPEDLSAIADAQKAITGIQGQAVEDL